MLFIKINNRWRSYKKVTYVFFCFSVNYFKYFLDVPVHIFYGYFYRIQVYTFSDSA